MSQRLTNTQKPKLGPVVQKLYTQTGDEVKNILSLQDDDEIWLSYGEPFIDPYSKSLHITLSIYLSIYLIKV